MPKYGKGNIGGKAKYYCTKCKKHHTAGTKIVKDHAKHLKW
jgi:hypothetical protein